MGDREFQDTGDEESLSTIQLSQESQRSAISINLSQELSQGSADADPPPASSKSKRDDKEKKKKKKSRKDKVRTKDAEGKEKTETSDNDQEAGVREKRTKKSSKSSNKSEKSDKSERKHKRHSSRRPEPEGGNPSQADTNFSAIEYDRIINNTDPLFSDLDGGLSDEETPKPSPRRPVRPPRPNRGGPSGGIFIPCTHLGINSNTMIKFAIIGTELQNIFQVSHRLESETAALNRRITLLEDDLERAEERLAGAQEKLDQASKAADESERQRRSVQNKLNIGDDRIDEIEKRLKEANETASDAQARYDEAARRVIVLERELTKTEEKSDEHERKARILEVELREISNNVKTIELVEETASQREDSYEETIRDLTQRLKDAETRAEHSERETCCLQKSLERMEDELNQAQDQNCKLKIEMEQCIEGLADL